MRLVRTIGLAAIAALAAMALVGASTASAEVEKPTVLCNVHENLECPAGHKVEGEELPLALLGGGVGQLLNSLLNVLCLNVLATVTPLDLGELKTTGAQPVHSLHSEYTGCGAEGLHNNCTVTVLEEPLFDLLKTGLDQGSATALNGKTEIECKNSTFFKITIKCKYNTTGLLLSAGGNHITANETVVNKESGTLCPSTSKIDGLLGPLGTTHSVQRSALCKTHKSEECAEGDRVGSLELTAVEPPVLLNPVANVECESSSAAATALGIVDKQSCR